MASDSFSASTRGGKRRSADISSSISVYDARPFLFFWGKNRSVRSISDFLDLAQMWRSSRVPGRRSTGARTSSGQVESGHRGVRTPRYNGFPTVLFALVLLHLFSATQVQQRHGDSQTKVPCRDGLHTCTCGQEKAFHGSSFFVWKDLVTLAEAGKIELTPPPPPSPGSSDGASDFGAPSHPLFGDVGSRHTGEKAADGEKGSGVHTPGKTALGGVGQESFDNETQQNKGLNEEKTEVKKDTLADDKIQGREKAGVVYREMDLPDALKHLKDGPISREALNAWKEKEGQRILSGNHASSNLGSAEESSSLTPPPSETTTEPSLTDRKEEAPNSVSDAETASSLPSPLSGISEESQSSSNEKSPGDFSENDSKRAHDESTRKQEMKDSSHAESEPKKTTPGLDVDLSGPSHLVKQAEKEKVAAIVSGDGGVDLAAKKAVDDKQLSEKEERGQDGTGGSPSKQPDEQETPDLPLLSGENGVSPPRRGEESETSEESTLPSSSPSSSQEQEASKHLHQRKSSRTHQTREDSGQKTDDLSRSSKGKNSSTHSDGKSKSAKRGGVSFQSFQKNTGEETPSSQTVAAPSSSEGQDNKERPDISTASQDPASYSSSVGQDDIDASSETLQAGEGGEKRGDRERKARGPQGGKGKQRRYDKNREAPSPPSTKTMDRTHDEGIDMTYSPNAPSSSSSEASGHAYNYHPPQDPSSYHAYPYRTYGQPNQEDSSSASYATYGEEEGQKQHNRREEPYHRRDSHVPSYVGGRGERHSPSHEASVPSDPPSYASYGDNDAQPSPQSVQDNFVENNGSVGPVATAAAAAAVPPPEGGDDIYQQYNENINDYNDGYYQSRPWGSSNGGGEEEGRKVMKYMDHENREAQPYSMYENPEKSLQATLEQHCDAWCTAEALKYWDESHRPIWASLHLQPVPSFLYDLRTGFFILLQYHAPMIQYLRFRLEKGFFDTLRGLSIASHNLHASHPSLWLFLVYLLAFLLLSRLITGHFFPSNPLLWFCHKRRERQKETKSRQDTAQAVVEKLLEQQQIKWLLTQTKKTSFVCEKLKGSLAHQKVEQVSSDIRISSAAATAAAAIAADSKAGESERERFAMDHKILQKQQDQIHQIFSILQRQEDRQNQLFDELQEQQRAAEETRELQLRRILSESKKQFDAAAFQQTQFSLVFLQALGRIICAVDPTYSPEEKERLEASITAYHQALQSNTHSASSPSFDNLDDEISLRGAGGEGEDPFNQLLNTTGLTPRPPSPPSKKDRMQQQSGISSNSSSLAPSPAETGGKERGENVRRRSLYKEEEGERDDGDNELDRQSWRGTAGRGGLEEEAAVGGEGERRRSSGGPQDESGLRDGGGVHPHAQHHRAGVVPSGLFGPPTSPALFNESIGSASSPPPLNGDVPHLSQQSPHLISPGQPLLVGNDMTASPDPSSSSVMPPSSSHHPPVGSSPHPPPSHHPSSSSHQNTPNGVSPAPLGASPYGVGGGMPGISSHIPSSAVLSSSSSLPSPHLSSAPPPSGGYFLPTPGDAKAPATSAPLAPAISSSHHLHSNSTPRATGTSSSGSNSAVGGGSARLPPAPLPQGLRDPFASSPPPSTDDIEGRGSSAGTSRSGSTLQATASAATTTAGRGGGGLIGAGGGGGASNTSLNNPLQSSSYLPPSSSSSYNTGVGGGMPGSGGLASPFGSVPPPVLPSEDLGGGGGYEGGGGPGGFGLLPRRISSTSSHASDRLSTFSSNDVSGGGGGGVPTGDKALGGGGAAGGGGIGGRYTRPPSGGRGGMMAGGGDIDEAGGGAGTGGMTTSPPPVGLTNGISPVPPAMNSSSSSSTTHHRSGGGRPSPQDAAPAGGGGVPPLSSAAAGVMPPPPPSGGGAVVYPPSNSQQTSSSRPQGRILRERREPPKIQAATNPFGFAPPPSSLSTNNGIDA